MVRADRWIQAAGPRRSSKVVPENYLLGDRAIYIDGFLYAQGLSPDGMIPRRCAQTAFAQAGQRGPGTTAAAKP